MLVVSMPHIVIYYLKITCFSLVAQLIHLLVLGKGLILVFFLFLKTNLLLRLMHELKRIKSMIRQHAKILMSKIKLPSSNMAWMLGIRGTMKCIKKASKIQKMHQNKREGTKKLDQVIKPMHMDFLFCYITHKIYYILEIYQIIQNIAKWVELNYLHNICKVFTQFQKRNIFSLQKGLYLAMAILQVGEVNHCL